MLPAAIVCLASTAGIWAGLYLLDSAWAALLLYHLALGAGLLWRSRRSPPARRALLRGWRPLPATLLLLMSAGFGMGLFLFIRQIDPTGVHVVERLRLIGLDGFWLLPFSIYTCVVNPPLEELYWRANYEAPRGWRFDFGYALLHTPLIASSGALEPHRWPLAVLGLVLAGWLWRFAARRCGGLASSVAGHAAADAALLGALALAAAR